MPAKRTISVIIPAYDEEAYLGPCLESLKNQSFSEFELIVVDNNSSDGTARIARAYTDRILFCPRRGISSARNFGATHAAGDILCFIDADGIVSRNWIQRVALAFSRRNEIDAVSGFNVFYGAPFPKSILYNIYNGVVFLCLLVGNHTGRPFVAGNNMAMTKRLFLLAGGFPEFVAEDVRLSKLMRRYRPSVAFDPTMIIRYSSRRFVKKGFWATLFLWIRSVWEETPESTYREDF
jgi:glycosyltransferase involved in cell wall biosynthesis